MCTTNGAIKVHLRIGQVGKICDTGNWLLAKVDIFNAFDNVLRVNRRQACCLVTLMLLVSAQGIRLMLAVLKARSTALANSNNTPEHRSSLRSGFHAGVRKNGLMVLTHLILNDMMKVKGHIARMAICLQDPDPRIRDLAHLFFHELSQKNYKVENVLLLLLLSLSTLF